MNRLGKMPSRAYLGFLIHDRKAKIAVSMGIGVLLVLSAVAYVAFLVPGASAYPPSPCTKTYSSISPPPTELAIVASGTYCFTSGETFNTQITVTVSDVTLTSVGGSHVATIQPTSPISTGTDPDNSLPDLAVVTVSGVSAVTGVTIQGLTVDGTGSQSTAASFGCGVDYAGILFLGASGSISDNTVTNINEGSPLYGCQTGLAILVETPASDKSIVSIAGNTVTNYQKNGITCDDAGSQCNIAGNTVSPLAAAQPFIGSNGIQVASGAHAQVTGNIVSGNECSLASACGDYLNDPSGNNLGNDAAGILLYQAGSSTVVNNQVSSNDFGISVLGINEGVQLENNQLTNNRYVGVMIEGGSYTVQNTQISGHSGAAAVAVEALNVDPDTGSPDASSSVTLVNVSTGLPCFTFASGEGLTAYIFAG
jgi:parallel beta-helix repeat protein